MQKSYPSVIAAVIIGVAIGYGLVSTASNVVNSAAENSMHFSVDKTTLKHGDALTWNATNLSPNAEYTIILSWSGTILVIGKGNANAAGEASGSFLIGENIAAGTVTLTMQSHWYQVTHWLTVH